MSEGDPSPRGDGAGGDGSSSKFNTRNPAVKRILREQREMLASDEDENDWALHAEMCEDDIFEWHFAIMGAEGSEFEGGIYHGRILLPPEYPFKPPSFMLLTPSGRFETMTKICLSITQHHPEHWQPSWSVRTALLAVRAFMPTPADGAVGSLEFTVDERRATKVRLAPGAGDTRDPALWKCLEAAVATFAFPEGHRGEVTLQLMLIKAGR